MKTLNYCMAVFFGLIGLICIIVAIISKQWCLLMVAAICFILYYVAWQDYKDELRRDEGERKIRKFINHKFRTPRKTNRPNPKNVNPYDSKGYKRTK